MNTLAQYAPTARYPFGQIAKRSALIAAIIGSTLTLINQWDAMTGNAALQVLPMVLVYVTPFLVVSISQVFGIREARKALQRNARIPPEFIRTLFSHGIIGRAVALGMAAGGINTVISAVALTVAGYGLNQLPVVAILQALSLPALFGALSQTLSFQRTVSQST